MRVVSVLILLLLAAPTTAGTGSLDREAQRDLVARTAGLVRDEYVFPGLAEEAAVGLTALAESEELAAPRSPEEFAAWISGHLKRLTRDQHVRVKPEEKIGDTPDSTLGIRAVERLDGGVGYLRIDRFYRADECRQAYDAALAQLATCRAVIIDLTENAGGSDANMLLASYFLGERTLMNRIEWRRGEPLEFWAGPTTVPALADVPLYVLVSGRTFSAAEGVAYALQQQKRAVIVGEASRGGANPNRYFPIGHGLAVSVSIGRTVNPVSLSNWEGVGVVPDVAVPAGESLQKARELIGQP